MFTPHLLASSKNNKMDRFIKHLTKIFTSCSIRINPMSIHGKRFLHFFEDEIVERCLVERNSPDCTIYEGIVKDPPPGQ